MSSEPSVAELAQRQLDAYNRADLDAFCACYADDVVVLDADGREAMAGMAAFRERYAGLFAQFRDVQATVTTRVTCGAHAVDHETWSRVDGKTGERSEGEILARYTARGGKISVVQFFR